MISTLEAISIIKKYNLLTDGLFIATRVHERGNSLAPGGDFIDITLLPDIGVFFVCFFLTK